jgi:hypothetical protein
MSQMGRRVHLAHGGFAPTLRGWASGEGAVGAGIGVVRQIRAALGVHEGKCAEAARHPQEGRGRDRWPNANVSVSRAWRLARTGATSVSQRWYRSSAPAEKAGRNERPRWRPAVKLVRLLSWDCWAAHAKQMQHRGFGLNRLAVIDPGERAAPDQREVVDREEGIVLCQFRRGGSPRARQAVEPG